VSKIKRIRTITAWILVGLGAIPAILLVLIAVIAGTLALAFVVPGLSIIPEQTIKYATKTTTHKVTIEKGSWLKKKI